MVIKSNRLQKEVQSIDEKIKEEKEDLEFLYSYSRIKIINIFEKLLKDTCNIIKKPYSIHKDANIIVLEIYDFYLEQKRRYDEICSKYPEQLIVQLLPKLYARKREYLKNNDLPTETTDLIDF